MIGTRSALLVSCSVDDRRDAEKNEIAEEVWNPGAMWKLQQRVTNPFGPGTFAPDKKSPEPRHGGHDSGLGTALKPSGWDQAQGASATLRRMKSLVSVEVPSSVRKVCHSQSVSSAGRAGVIAA